jgi:hypothetical protein
MLTRSGKKTLTLKLNDPHVHEYISSIEQHLCRHIDDLQAEIRDADEMYYEKVDELEATESYAYELRNSLLSVRQFGMLQSAAVIILVGLMGYSCRC